MMGVLGTENLPLQISMIVAALGYSDIAVSTTPSKKSKISAIRLMVYSTILLLFSVLAKQYTIFLWIVAIFAPLGHEALILWGQREEKSRTPLFRHHHRGITVLDVKKDGHGKEIGLHSGDVILKINNYPIDHKDDIHTVLNGFPRLVRMEIIDELGKYKTLEYRNDQIGMANLGVIIVPKESQVVFHLQTTISPVKKLIGIIRD
jgi:membrane-associated protease RseP (regulator of RpoE activity)